MTENLLATRGLEIYLAI